MADIFLTSDVHKLLKNKYIMFIGDSNIRAQYKDLIWLLNHNSLISQNDLKAKQTGPLVGDEIVERSTTYGRKFREQREYEKDGIRVDFHFVTQCFSPVVEELLEDIHLDLHKAPDVIFINSTLWDVTRWGPNGVTKFKDSLVTLAKTLKGSLPRNTLVIWGTALPIAPKIESSLLIKQIYFLEKTLRFDVMEANLFARQVMVNFGHDVLDNHFYMRMQIHRRVRDGVHFFNVGIRFLTNLLLTHIALSWDCKLPNRIETLLLEKSKKLSLTEKKEPDPVLPKTPKAVKTKSPKYRKTKRNNFQGNRRNRLNQQQQNCHPNRQCNQRTIPQTLRTALHEYHGPIRNNGPMDYPPQPWMDVQPIRDHNEVIRNITLPSLIQMNDGLRRAYAMRMSLTQNQRYQPY